MLNFGQSSYSDVGRPQSGRGQGGIFRVDPAQKGPAFF